MRKEQNEAVWLWEEGILKCMVAVSKYLKGCHTRRGSKHSVQLQTAELRPSPSSGTYREHISTVYPALSWAESG